MITSMLDLLVELDREVGGDSDAFNYERENYFSWIHGQQKHAHAWSDKDEELSVSDHMEAFIRIFTEKEMVESSQGSIVYRSRTFSNAYHLKKIDL
uniref:Uncharacterized protein n=1 Tax=Panagrolaimus sp. JU765 TaxID=591449 RepID=A0AC34QKF3_9BILA